MKFSVVSVSKFFSIIREMFIMVKLLQSLIEFIFENFAFIRKQWDCEEISIIKMFIFVNMIYVFWLFLV